LHDATARYRGLDHLGDLLGRLYLLSHGVLSIGDVLCLHEITLGAP
jgi:hypothetical protein